MLSIVFTGVTGAAMLVNGILSIVTLVQHARLKRFAREVVESIEPVMPGLPSPIPPIEVWPSERTAVRRNLSILIAVGVAIASLMLLFVTLRHG